VLDGFGFMKEVHAAAGDDRPPVIAITGLGSGPNREQTRRGGFHARLEKPFKERELVAAITSAVAPARLRVLQNRRPS
jgi:DNA-binding response OmpR family regulator